MDSIISRAARTLFQTHRLHDFAAKSNGTLRVIRTKAELRDLIRLREEHRENPIGKEPVVGAMLGIEGLHALDDKFENVAAFFSAGISQSKGYTNYIYIYICVCVCVRGKIIII